VGSELTDRCASTLACVVPCSSSVATSAFEDSAGKKVCAGSFSTGYACTGDSSSLSVTSHAKSFVVTGLGISSQFHF